MQWSPARPSGGPEHTSASGGVPGSCTPGSAGAWQPATPGRALNARHLWARQSLGCSGPKLLGCSPGRWGTVTPGGGRNTARGVGPRSTQNWACDGTFNFVGRANAFASRCVHLLSCPKCTGAPCPCLLTGTGRGADFSNFAGRAGDGRCHTPLVCLAHPRFFNKPEYLSVGTSATGTRVLCSAPARLPTGFS